MAVRTLTVKAHSKGRMTVTARVQIVTEPGTLMQDELNTLRTDIAGKLMVLLTETRFLNVPLSEIKVSR